MSTLTPHGIAGQLNICVLDVHSIITAFGKHNRLIVMLDVHDRTSLEIREDIRGLPLSTVARRRHIATKTYTRLHPRGTHIEYVSSTVYDNGTAIAHMYKIVPNKRK